MSTRQEIREELAKQLGETGYANFPQIYLDTLINRAIDDAFPIICDVVEEETIEINNSTVTSTGISFAANKTISDTGNGLAAFHTGDAIWVSGSASNDGRYTIASGGGTAGSFTVTEALTLEAAGASVTISADPLEYALPSGTEQLAGDIYVEGDVLSAYTMIRNFKVEKGRLRLESAPTAGKKLRLTSVKRFPPLATDAATTTMPKEYIIAFCLREIWANRVNSGRGDAKLATSMMDRYANQAENLKRRNRTPIPRTRIQSPWVSQID